MRDRIPFDSQELAFVVILFAVAFFAPLFGFVLALVVALYSHSQANIPLRNAAAAATVFAVVATLVRAALWSQVLIGF